jgi:CRP/FNR family transcriptional regulator, cyclic AMP receptor protein
MALLRKDAKIKLLSKVPLFAACTKAELEEIAALADEVRLPAGRKLIREGRRGREFFVLVEGSVEVTRDGETLRTLGDGDFFGEIALVSSVPRTSSVTATTPVRVLVITDRAFQDLLQDAPSMSFKVLQALAERLETVSRAARR